MSVLLLLPASAGAMTYGSDDYGACEFEDGCAVTTTPSTASNPVAIDSTNSTDDANTTDDTAASDTTGTSIILNTFEDFFSDAGKNVTDLKVGGVVEFCIGSFAISQICDASSNTHHTTTLKSVDLGAGAVVITVASTPTDYTLILDTPMKIDINKDKTEDIEITLTSLSATTANITFRSLETSTPKALDVTNESTPKAIASWLWWVGGVSLLALLAAIIKKKRGGGGKGESYGSGPMGSSTSGGEPSN